MFPRPCSAAGMAMNNVPTVLSVISSPKPMVSTRLKWKMMGKMNRPARNATPKSDTAIVTASFAKFSLDLRYDA